MTMLYSHLCYKEVCYKGTALYYGSYRPCSKESTTLMDKHIDGSTLFHIHNFKFQFY